jgi:hypothetical protein
MLSGLILIYSVVLGLFFVATSSCGSIAARLHICQREWCNSLYCSILSHSLALRNTVLEEVYEGRSRLSKNDSKLINGFNLVESEETTKERKSMHHIASYVI